MTKLIREIRNKKIITKILIDKHTKHKEKIMSLKTKNKMLEEELYRKQIC